MDTEAEVIGAYAEGCPTLIHTVCRKGMQAYLRRDERNKTDPNAVEVCLVEPRLFGLLGHLKNQVGYTDSNESKFVAEEMDFGATIKASVTSYWVPEDIGLQLGSRLHYFGTNR